MNLEFPVGTQRGKMILDKLLEKKDLLAYIDFRVEFLSLISETELMRLPERDRESLKQRFVGRQQELKMLKKLIAQDKIRKMGKKYFYEINKGVD